MSRVPDLDSVATPSVVVDGTTLRANIGAMAERARVAGLEMRPHSKTHKSVAVAALQREQGAAGLTVATVREAECFAAAGVDDLLVAHPPVGQWRLQRLTALAKETRVRVVLDSGEAVTPWTLLAGVLVSASATCGRSTAASAVAARRPASCQLSRSRW